MLASDFEATAAQRSTEAATARAAAEAQANVFEAEALRLDGGQLGGAAHLVANLVEQLHDARRQLDDALAVAGSVADGISGGTAAGSLADAAAAADAHWATSVSLRESWSATVTVTTKLLMSVKTAAGEALSLAAARRTAQYSLFVDAFEEDAGVGTVNETLASRQVAEDALTAAKSVATTAVVNLRRAVPSQHPDVAASAAATSRAAAHLRACLAHRDALRSRLAATTGAVRAGSDAAYGGVPAGICPRCLQPVDAATHAAGRAALAADVEAAVAQAATASRAWSAARYDESAEVDRFNRRLEAAVSAAAAVAARAEATAEAARFIAARAVARRDQAARADAAMARLEEEEAAALAAVRRQLEEVRAAAAAAGVHLDPLDNTGALTLIGDVPTRPNPDGVGGGLVGADHLLAPLPGASWSALADTVPRLWTDAVAEATRLASVATDAAAAASMAVEDASAAAAVAKAAVVAATTRATSAAANVSALEAGLATATATAGCAAEARAAASRARAAADAAPAVTLAASAIELAAMHRQSAAVWSAAAAAATDRAAVAASLDAAFGVRGVQSFLMEDVLADLAARTNKYLSSLCAPGGGCGCSSRRTRGTAMRVAVA
eukprot:TRINITY_DN4286_c0_g1_i8.p2 TRINITY_DN4286_c0_g1~~TRINITY_DN4286_c0_g1_i8.p2  ORF type:complete len:614 (-),score=109.66 TRINITY_DN4286_c0_g1_i8:817-2658(-)